MWEQYSEEEQAEILFRWEEIRGAIPDRIKALEMEINEKQERLGNEDDFIASCRLNAEIAELASVINDLHLWFRANQEMEGKLHQ